MVVGSAMEFVCNEIQLPYILRLFQPSFIPQVINLFVFPLSGRSRPMYLKLLCALCAKNSFDLIRQHDPKLRDISHASSK